MQSFLTFVEMPVAAGHVETSAQLLRNGHGRT